MASILSFLYFIRRQSEWHPHWAEASSNLLKTQHTPGNHNRPDAGCYISEERVRRPQSVNCGARA